MGLDNFNFHLNLTDYERADNIDDLELLTTPPVTETISNLNAQFILTKIHLFFS